MSAKARPKYKCKNVGEYKVIRKCTHKEGCDEYGIVSYRNDPPSGTVKVEFRCIEHVHKEKVKPEIVEKAENKYTVMTDISKWLAIDHSWKR